MLMFIRSLLIHELALPLSPRRAHALDTPWMLRKLLGLLFPCHWCDAVLAMTVDEARASAHPVLEKLRCASR